MFSRLGATPADDESVVVLVNCLGGPELRVVEELLRTVFHTPTLLIEPADLVATRFGYDLQSGLLSVADRVVRPAVVWVRHGSVGALTARGPRGPAGWRAGVPLWSALLDLLAETTGVGLPGCARSGPGQLADAAALGIRTPRTVIACGPGGDDDPGGTALIVKIPDFRLVEPDTRAWSALFPRFVGPGLAGARRNAHQAHQADQAGARLVQEYVPHESEVRVYYADGGLCAFDVSKPEASSIWTDPDSVVVRRIACPPDVASAVQRLSAAWGMRYGAFDLLTAPDTDPVFLEANPDGDWLWFENKAAWHGVTLMVAAMVRDLFVRRTGGAPRQDDDRGCRDLAS